MARVGHLGSQLQTIFVEQDDEGNVTAEIPVKFSTRVFSFAGYLDLFRQAWEQRNEVRKGCGLEPLPLPDAYELALAHVRAETAPKNGRVLVAAEKE